MYNLDTEADLDDGANPEAAPAVRRRDRILTNFIVLYNDMIYLSSSTVELCVELLKDKTSIICRFKSHSFPVKGREEKWRKDSVQPQYHCFPQVTQNCVHNL